MTNNSFATNQKGSFVLVELLALKKFLRCATKRETWQQKMADGREPQIEKSDKDFAEIKAGQKMLILQSAVTVNTLLLSSRGTRVLWTESEVLRND